MGKVVSAKTGTITVDGKIVGNIFAGFTGAIDAAPSGSTPAQIDAITRQQIEKGRSPDKAILSASEVGVTQEKITPVPAPTPPSDLEVRAIQRRQETREASVRRLLREKGKSFISPPETFRERLVGGAGTPVQELERSIAQRRIEAAREVEVSAALVDPRVRERLEAAPAPDVVRLRQQRVNDEVEGLNKVAVELEIRANLSTKKLSEDINLHSRRVAAFNALPDEQKTLNRFNQLEKETRTLSGRIGNFVLSEKRRKETFEKDVERVERRKAIEFPEKAKALPSLVSIEPEKFTPPKFTPPDFPAFAPKFPRGKPPKDIVQAGAAFLGTQREAAGVFGEAVAAGVVSVLPKEIPIRPQITPFGLTPEFTLRKQAGAVQRGALVGRAVGELGFSVASVAVAPVRAVTAPLFVSEIIQDKKLVGDVALGAVLEFGFRGAGGIARFARSGVVSKFGKGKVLQGYNIGATAIGKGVTVGLGTAFVAGTAAELGGVIQDPAKFRKVSRSQAQSLTGFLFGTGIGRGLDAGFLEPLENRIILRKELNKLSPTQRVQAEKALEIAGRIVKSKGVLKGKNIKPITELSPERLSAEEAKVLNEYLKNPRSGLKRIILGGTGTAQLQIGKKVKASDADLYSKDFRVHAEALIQRYKEAGIPVNVVNKKTAVLLFFRGAKGIEIHSEAKIIGNLTKSRKFFEPIEWNIVRTRDGVQVISFDSLARRKAAGGIEEPGRISKDFPFLQEAAVALGEPIKAPTTASILGEQTAQFNLGVFAAPTKRAFVIKRPVNPILAATGLQKSAIESPFKAQAKQRIDFKVSEVIVSQPSFLRRRITQRRTSPFVRIKTIQEELTSISGGRLPKLTEPFKIKLTPMVSGGKILPKLSSPKVSGGKAREIVSGGKTFVKRENYINPINPIKEKTIYKDLRKQKTPTYINSLRRNKNINPLYNARLKERFAPALPIPRRVINPYRDPRVPFENYINPLDPPDEITPPPRIGKRFLFPKIKAKKTQAVLSSKQAFAPFIKVKGKFIRFGTIPLTLKAAFGKGLLKIDRTALRTLEVRKVAGKPQRLEFGFDVFAELAKKTRKPIKDGRELFGSPKFIERNIFAIDSAGERREITDKGLRALATKRLHGKIKRKKTRRRKK